MDSLLSMAPFTDADIVGRSSNSANVDNLILMNDAQPKSFPTIYSFTIEEGHYSKFDESGEVLTPPQNNIMLNTIIYRFCSWYSTQNEVNPLRTISLTGGICAFVGDILAQCIEKRTSLRTESTEGLHHRRTLAVFIAGLCYGPLLHYTYALLEYILPIHCEEQWLGDGATASTQEDDIVDQSNLKPISAVPPYTMCYSTMFHSFSLISTKKYVNAFLHVAIDQGIMAFPFVAIMMLITGIVEGHWNKLGKEFSEDYMDNIHALWIAALFGIGPIQIVAFRFLDLKWRALAANILDVLEVMVMSYLTHRNRKVPDQ